MPSHAAGLQIRWRLAVAAALILAASLTALPARASDPVTFTVETASLLGRAVPSTSGRILASLFKGQTFNVIGRLADNSWLQIDLGGPPGPAWVAASFGTVRGDLSTVAVITAATDTTDVAPPAATADSSTPSPPADSGAAGGSLPVTAVKFTVTYKAGVYVRSGPSTTYKILGSALAGRTFGIRARNSISNWVMIDYPGAPEAWVWRYAGDITGNLPSVPVAGSSAPAATGAAVSAPIAAAGTPGNALGFTAASLLHARQIYQLGQQLGRNPHAFSRVGDSNAETTAFLSDFDGGNYSLGGYGYLQDAIDYFHGAFSRAGAAVQGFTTWGILDKTYADPKLCDAAEGALACEFRIQNPAVALVMIGTNDVWVRGAVPDELYLRQIIQAAVNRGIVPVISTIAWNPSSSYYPAALAVNATIRKIAAEQNVPLWDFYQSVQSLPNNGIGNYSWDPHAHLSDQPGGNAYFLADPYLQAGMTRHNLEALQALYAIYKNVIAP